MRPYRSVSVQARPRTRQSRPGRQRFWLARAIADKRACEQVTGFPTLLLLRTPGASASSSTIRISEALCDADKVSAPYLSKAALHMAAFQVFTYGRIETFTEDRQDLNLMDHRASPRPYRRPHSSLGDLTPEEFSSTATPSPKALAGAAVRRS